MKFIARVDNNQPDIVRTYRQVGATVGHLHNLGGGIPDLVVGVNGVTIVSNLISPTQAAWALAKIFPGNTFKVYAGANLMIEVKDGSQPPSKQKLTPDEEQWHAAWKGPVLIVKSENEALESVAAAP